MNALLVATSLLVAAPLGPGDHTLSIKVDDLNRSYIVHVPKGYEADHPMPVVMVFHGAGTNAAIMVALCGMNEKADEAGFIAVYPNGTGLGPFKTFNAGGLVGKMAEGKPDDVRFVAALLDVLATIVNVDPKRVYATGISNGGMMCYRLASELSDRIAAIAPVSGTMAFEEARPKRSVPIMHFHGTADRIVPYAGPDNGTPIFLTFKSVEDTIQHWAKINKCNKEPLVEKLEDKTEDGTSVTKTTYKADEDGTEVVLIEIVGGGHTWPGKQPPLSFMGKSTKDISANDMMWKFFERHPKQDDE